MPANAEIIAAQYEQKENLTLEEKLNTLKQQTQDIRARTGSQSSSYHTTSHNLMTYLFVMSSLFTLCSAVETAINGTGEYLQGGLPINGELFLVQAFSNLMPLIMDLYTNGNLTFVLECVWGFAGNTSIPYQNSSTLNYRTTGKLTAYENSEMTQEFVTNVPRNNQELSKAALAKLKCMANQIFEMLGGAEVDNPLPNKNKMILIIIGSIVAAALLLTPLIYLAVRKYNRSSYESVSDGREASATVSTRPDDADRRLLYS